MSTLYSKISANGYKILYLTNRPLADWHAKKGAAVAAAEGGGAVLPRGPVLCPPEVLFRSTSSKDRRGHQEVSPLLQSSAAGAMYVPWLVLGLRFVLCGLFL